MAFKSVYKLNCIKGWLKTHIPEEFYSLEISLLCTYIGLQSRIEFFLPDVFYRPNQTGLAGAEWQAAGVSQVWNPKFVTPEPYLHP